MPYLERILDTTRARIDEAKAKIDQAGLEQRLAAVPAARDFRAALAGEELALIAEIKRASPSKGMFDENLSASAAAAAFSEGGAAAISVMTEPFFFRGQLDDIGAAAGAELPVLRKDFVLDTFQVMEARAARADAVLVIVRIVDDETLGSLLRSARALGLAALVEVHDDVDLRRALEHGADLVGVNHRDLETFEVDPERTAKLAPHVPGDVLLVGLSGVQSRSDVIALREAGAAAALVGEALVISPDPAAKLRELRGVS